MGLLLSWLLTLFRKLSRELALPWLLVPSGLLSMPYVTHISLSSLPPSSRSLLHRMSASFLLRKTPIIPNLAVT